MSPISFAPQDDLASEHRRMAELLCKFRIDFTDVVMIPDVQRKPREDSLKDFQNLISNFLIDPEEGEYGGVFTGLMYYG